MNARQVHFLKHIVILSLFAVGLGLIRFLLIGHTSYIWLNWNLFLALIPILFAWLAVTLKKKWIIGFMVFAWLGFLPNAPYIITDFIHLADVGPKSLLWFDAIMIFVYSLAGLFSWLLSFNILENHLRWKPWVVWFVGLLSGFGIYLGRYIRFNTWDIFSTPLSLLEKIGDIIISPIEYDPVIAMTLIFMCLLAGTYTYTKPLIYDEKNKN
ncbi:MAG: putative membrane protein [Crocinitomicaceae bacterium]|jgi:uncharacterized membrane protein